MSEKIVNAYDETAFQLTGSVKSRLRITHNCLDYELTETISAALRDLEVCGVITLTGETSNVRRTTDPSSFDPLILNAVKLYCQANFTDDTTKAAAYMSRYDSLKATLMMAEGYGRRDSDG